MTKHWPLLIIILVQSLVLAKLIYFPYPELFVYPYLTNQGLLPYGQILDQHFPGLMFLPLNLNNLGMTNEIIARWWSIGIVVVTQIILYAISLKIFRSRKKALMVSILYAIWQPFFEGWVLWIDSFLPLMLLPAFYFTWQAIVQQKLRPVVLAGLFLGLAIVFKQVVIPLACLVGLLLLFYRRKWSTVLGYVGGLVPAPLLMTGYFWLKGVFVDFWYWTVTFNLTTFAESGRKPPFLTGVVRLVGVYLPVLGLFVAERKLALSLAVFILGGLMAIYARFDFVHLQPSLPFVMIATVLLFDRLARRNWGWVVIGLYFVILVWWSVIFYQGHLSNKVFFFDSETLATAAKIEQLTEPGEEIFLFGPVLHLYYLSETIPAGRIFVFQFPWFFEKSQDRLLAGLIESQAKLILRDRTVIIEGRPITEFGRELDMYIEQNYEVFDQIGNTEFMRKKN